MGHLRILQIVCSPIGGSSVYDIICEAISLAKKEKCEVRFAKNGVSIRVDSSSIGWKMFEKYDKAFPLMRIGP